MLRLFHVFVVNFSKVIAPAMAFLFAEILRNETYEVATICRNRYTDFANVCYVVCAVTQKGFEGEMLACPLTSVTPDI